MGNSARFFLVSILVCLGVAKASIRPWFGRVAQECSLALQHVEEINPPPVFFREGGQPVFGAVEDLRWGFRRLDEHLAEWERFLPDVKGERLLDNFNSTYEPKLAPLVDGRIAKDAEYLMDLNELLVSRPGAKVEVALREYRDARGIMDEAVFISVAGVPGGPYAMASPYAMNSELVKRLRAASGAQLILGAEETSAVRQHLGWAVNELGALNQEMKRLDARRLDLLKRTTAKWRSKG